MKAKPNHVSATAHRIVFANEKGGTGKSTTAVHVAIALAYQGAKVAAIDLDPRQRTFHRYLENRTETERRRGITLPGARFAVFNGDSISQLDEMADELAEGMDFLLFDTPGRDDDFARHVATKADTLVTPLNDSFVDFDLIGQVDAETFKVRRLSFYAELIWEARKKRAMATIQDKRREMDWVVVRNRMRRDNSRARQQWDAALDMLAQRQGFRLEQGLGERAAYRELAMLGLTHLDLASITEFGRGSSLARAEIAALRLAVEPAEAEPQRALA